MFAHQCIIFSDRKGTTCTKRLYNHVNKDTLDHIITAFRCVDELNIHSTVFFQVMNILSNQRHLQVEEQA